MQNRPDASTLLDAVASFLMAEVAPKLEGDKALQFRMMIAANLATVVAAELRTEDDRFAAEAQRLKALVPGDMLWATNVNGHVTPGIRVRIEDQAVRSVIVKVDAAGLLPDDSHSSRIVPPLNVTCPAAFGAGQVCACATPPVRVKAHTPRRSTACLVASRWFPWSV